ncbi:hypothetical protein [Vibrio porteresiae]|uniref:Uncharacterized protein n=1 Tax=Vibrio porteresiae DSM 19223 TaxID=1123496 RepID=A0ABZ0QHM1_9VIBR|nr:hypothetical protein [Vibrio porteresiae]WPC76004.1 hypothetical protein R8Z52_24130 [Vibrio porteresiae DSM 19223]
MSQVMQISTVLAHTASDKKTYAVNFKGLISHLVDILFVDHGHVQRYDSAQLSAHLQRDIGISR